MNFVFVKLRLTERALCSWLNLKNGQPGTKAEKYSVAEIMQKADSIPSAGTEADSEQKDQDISASSHDTKPHVVGSHCLGSSLENVSPETVTNVDINGSLISLSYRIGNENKFLFISHAALINACENVIRQATFQTFSGSLSGSHTSCKTFQ